MSRRLRPSPSWWSVSVCPRPLRLRRLRSLQPLDRAALLALARRCHRVLIVHEDSRTGGIGESLAAIVQEEAFEWLDAPVRIVGALETHDRRGVDHKLLCVPLGDPRFNRVQNLSDMNPHWLREIETFFATYKDLEDEVSEVLGWKDATVARTLLDAARARWAALA